MAFTITAELPLGTYRGAGADGLPERLPSVARLHSALLSAAGFGPRSVLTGDTVELSDGDAVALRWLEEHPPDGVSIPPLHVNRGQATAYREDGTLRTLRPRKLGKTADASVAVGGAFRWSWDAGPPAGVAASLAALCADVSHLGTTESPVRMHTDAPAADGEPEDGSYRLQPEADFFGDGTGLDVEVPLDGRTDELSTFHTAAGTRPRPASDRVSSSEVSSAPVPPRTRTALARYVPRQRVRQDTPWRSVLLLPLARGVAVEDRVRFCVAAHRALVAAAAGGPREDGGSAPPLITGVHPSGTTRPANGLAFQVVTAEHAGASLPASTDSALALLVPREAPAPELAALAGALPFLRSVRSAATGSVRVVGPPVEVSADTFWDASPAGTLRAWRSVVPAVPETRGGPGWTFREAALLSLAYVWRHRFAPAPGRGLERAEAYLAMAADVAEVLDARPLRTRAVERYAHTTNAHAVIRPYEADLRLDEEFFGSRTLQAIGQSRHVGGGLLHPVDLDLETLPGEGTPS